MASKVKNLPIYKAGYKLMRIITELSKNFPRNYRHTIGRKVQDEATCLVLSVYKANSAFNKVPHIQAILDQVLLVEMLSQLSFDLKIIPHNAYAEIIDITGSIGKQAGGWKKHAEHSNV